MRMLASIQRQESTLFKAHRKRKNNINTSDSKFDKKMDSQMLNVKVRIESDSESDSSISLSQCEEVLS